MQFAQPRYGTPADICGTVMWSIGFTVENVADIQKYIFRSNPANKGRVCDVGYFAWSRHPNYFGEMLMQFGEYSWKCGRVHVYVPG